MLKEELLSIQNALNEMQKHIKGLNRGYVAELLQGCRRNLKAAAEQAEALENNLAVVSVEVGAEDMEIRLPFAGNLTVSAKDIKIAGVLPGRMFKEVV